MAICKFWRNGTCRNGDSCRFEHPGGNSQGNRAQNQRPPPQNNNNSNNNRFGALGGHTVTPSNNTNYNQNYNSNQRNQPNAGFASHQRNQQSRGPQSRNRRDPRSLPYHLSYDIFDEDLKRERPQWIMSCYGPGRDAPIQLFGGFPLEQSPEEIRVQHYLAQLSGNPQQSAQTEQELANQANQQVQAVLGDVDGAIDYIIEGGKTHPNRQDMVIRAPNPGRGYGIFSKDRPNKPRYEGPSAPSGFSNTQPSNFGNQGQQGFGSQAFGTPNTQQSAFGQPPGNAFSGTPGFNAQPIQSIGMSGVPAPSPFGGQQPAINSFGQPQQGANTFGQPQNQAPFQQPAQPSASPFGQPQTGIFARPQDAQNSQGFTQNLQQQSQQPSQPFGQPQQQIQASTNAFGQQTSTAFGAPQQDQAQNNFSSFGSQAVSQPPPMSTFGAPAPDQGFGQTSASVQQNQQMPATNDPGHAVLNNQNQTPANGAMAVHPDLTTYSTRDNNGRLTTWKGASVNYMDNVPHYRRPDGTWERIWFPDGAPAAQGWEMPVQDYPQEMVQAFNFLSQNGGFQGGVMPDMAPRTEWARFDV